MLDRVLEPEVMDAPEEAKDYNAMDHAEVNRVFVDDLLAGGVIPEAILDLGTGTALIPIELCRRVANLRVVAVDLSASMLEVARTNLQAAAVMDRISLDCVDAKRLPYRDGLFRCVVSNSILHHIPEPLIVLREATRVLADGGQLLFRDLARPESDSRLHELVDAYAGDANSHQRAMFANSLRAALTVDEMRDLVVQVGFGRDDVRMSSDRHWTWEVKP